MAINSVENKATSNTQCRVGPSTVVITLGGAVGKPPSGRAVLDSGVRWPGRACHTLPENRRAHPDTSNMIKPYSLQFTQLSMVAQEERDQDLLVQLQ